MGEVAHELELRLRDGALDPREEHHGRVVRVALHAVAEAIALELRADFYQPKLNEWVLGRVPWSEAGIALEDVEQRTLEGKGDSSVPTALVERN